MTLDTNNPSPNCVGFAKSNSLELSRGTSVHLQLANTSKKYLPTW